VAEIRQVSLTGPRLEANVTGTLAIGDTAQSTSSMTSPSPTSSRSASGRAAASGSAHIVGKATGPDRNRHSTARWTPIASHSTTAEALTLKSTYTAMPNMVLEQTRVQADTTATFLTVAGINLPASANIRRVN
jgi:hypothetical protein